MALTPEERLQWSCLLDELRELRKEIVALRKENGVNIMRGAQHVANAVNPKRTG